MKIVKVVYKFCVSIHIRTTLVELLNAMSSITMRIINVIGNKTFSIVFRLNNLKTLKHKLILSFGEKWGLDDVVGDFVGDDIIAAAGKHNSFALSIFSRFIIKLWNDLLTCV